MDTDQIWKLLAKYFSREASSHEKNRIEEWRSKSVENQRIFELFQYIWTEDTTSNLPEDIDIDIDKAWIQTRYKLESPELSSRKTSEFKKAGKQRRKNVKVFKLGKFIRYATAAVLLLAAVISTFILFPSQDYTFSEGLIYKTEAGEILVIQLDDGSEVSLAPMTTLNVSSNFGHSSREVELNGEAYFSVESDQEPPFWVYTKNSITKVLGTQFNVKARSAGTSLEVYVAEGTVAVAKGNRDWNDEDIKLNEGDLLQTDEQLNIYEVQSNIEELTYLKWRQGLIYFDDLPLYKISERLERWYPVEIIVQSENIENMRLTAEFSSTQALEDILKEISFALNIEFEKDQETIIFY